MKLCLLIGVLLWEATAQQYTTPVPILKQINKHNEDGSYSYGYEAADGTYKIETKYPNGEVFGKYGYIDDQGQLRTVEYGASQRGFEPAGNEIQVPPPTLKNDYQTDQRPLGPNEEDDGQYREDPSVYYKNDYREPPRYQQPQPQYQSQPQYRSRYQPEAQPQYQPRPQPAFRPQSNFNFAPTPTRYNNPAPPAYPNYNAFQGHPASNVDIVSGSYSVNYRK